MERREHYDPEDIEQLLLDRGFDELLEEERAYVLRHLSGREEYEAMRRLLQEMQRTEADHEVLEPPARVRDAVIANFRDAHRPQWRVWLNSVGASLLPKDASAMWRPALALGGLALLIGLAVWVVAPDRQAQEVAELRKEEAKGRTDNPTTGPEQVAPIQQPVGPSPDVEAQATDAASASAPGLGSVKSIEANGAVAATDREALMDDMASVPATAQAAEAATADMVLEFHQSGSQVADSLVRGELYATPTATNSGYLNNWSLANAQGEVARQVAVAKEEQARSKRKPAKDELEAFNTQRADDNTLALLRAAW